MKEPTLSNVDIVVFALYRLGGLEKKIHTEKIALECFRLAKKRFSWRLSEFSKFPDKEPVRIALMDAAKEKHGALVEGRSGVEASGKESDGWVLTPAGARWIAENTERIEQKLDLFGAGTNRPDALRIKKRFHQDPAFKKFLQQGSLSEVSQYEFTDMLNCTPDASRSTIQKKFERLKAQASILDDDSIRNFIQACKERFKDLLVEKIAGGENETGKT